MDHVSYIQLKGNLWTVSTQDHQMITSKQFFGGNPPPPHLLFSFPLFFYTWENIVNIAPKIVVIHQKNWLLTGYEGEWENPIWVPRVGVVDWGKKIEKRRNWEEGRILELEHEDQKEMREFIPRCDHVMSG